MALLFQGLHDGRYVRFRLCLGIGDMPLLNDEAGAVLAYLRAARRHINGVPAAGLRQNPAAIRAPITAPAMTFAQLSLIPQPVRRPVSQLTFSLFVLILFSSEMLKKRHGGGILDCELLVLGRGENSASPLLINRLNSQ